jgi:hypothetical protein
MEIPKNIFQTWHTKLLSPSMANAILKIKKYNPEFNHYLFDDDDCRNFIKNNFDSSVLSAYDRLIPGAYKADLWRYCVLYKKGGIYLDIKYTPINGFKFIHLLKNEHWTMDIDNNGVYNALMVNQIGNITLLNAINKIVENVNNKFYGNCGLEPTGPKLLIKFFSKEQQRRFDLRHTMRKINNLYIKFIQFRNKNILVAYPSYYKEHRAYAKKKHYSELWNERRVYL